MKRLPLRGATIDAVRDAVTAAGAKVKIVAPKVGGAKLADGSLQPADAQLAGAPSVIFDAVAVILSDAGASLLAGDSAALDFVSDAYAHLKALALDTPMEVRRVADLRGTLDTGIEALAGSQWLVVPEPVFGHPTLRRLGLVAQIRASLGFGGHLGYDYEIYAVPRIASPSGANEAERRE